jgi:hypothetical protein
MTCEVIEITDHVVEVLEISAPQTELVEIILQGPQGPMGPPNTTPLSIDAGNQLVLGTDGGLYAHTMWANTPDW